MGSYLDQGIVSELVNNGAYLFWTIPAWIRHNADIFGDFICSTLSEGGWSLIRMVDTDKRYHILAYI
jgi:hypothetical protein